MGGVTLMHSRFVYVAVAAVLLCGVRPLCAAESASVPNPNVKSPLRNTFENVYREIDRIDLLVKGNAKYVDLGEEIHREDVARTQRNAADAMLTEITQRSQELDQLQKNVDATLSLKSKQQALGDKTGKLAGDVKEGVAQNENLKLLMSLYESVKPDEAAELLKRLPLPVAVTMIEQMSPRKSSKILSAMDPKFAAEVSRRIIHGGETVAKATENAPHAAPGAANIGAPATTTPPSAPAPAAEANATAPLPPPSAASGGAATSTGGKP